MAQILSSAGEAKLPWSRCSSSDQRRAGLQPTETLSNFLRIHFQHLGSTKSQQKHTATELHLKALGCQQPCRARRKAPSGAVPGCDVRGWAGSRRPVLLPAGQEKWQKLLHQGLVTSSSSSHPCRVWHCWLQPLNAAFVSMCSRLLRKAKDLHPGLSLSLHISLPPQGRMWLGLPFLTCSFAFVFFFLLKIVLFTKRESPWWEQACNKKLKLYKTFPWRVSFTFWAPLACFQISMMLPLDEKPSFGNYFFWISLPKAVVKNSPSQQHPSAILWLKVTSHLTSWRLSSQGNAVLFSTGQQWLW